VPPNSNDDPATFPVGPPRPTADRVPAFLLMWSGTLLWWARSRGELLSCSGHSHSYSGSRSVCGRSQIRRPQSDLLRSTWLSLFFPRRRAYSRSLEPVSRGCRSRVLHRRAGRSRTGAKTPPRHVLGWRIVAGPFVDVAGGPDPRTTSCECPDRVADPAPRAQPAVPLECRRQPLWPAVRWDRDRREAGDRGGGDSPRRRGPCLA
jgi:hypothetical protein